MPSGRRVGRVVPRPRDAVDMGDRNRNATIASGPCCRNRAASAIRGMGPHQVVSARSVVSGAKTNAARLATMHRLLGHRLWRRWNGRRGRFDFSGGMAVAAVSKGGMVVPPIRKSGGDRPFERASILSAFDSDLEPRRFLRGSGGIERDGSSGTHQVINHSPRQMAFDPNPQRLLCVPCIDQDQVGSGANRRFVTHGTNGPCDMGGPCRPGRLARLDTRCDSDRIVRLGRQSVRFGRCVETQDRPREVR